MILDAINKRIARRNAEIVWEWLRDNLNDENPRLDLNNNNEVFEAFQNRFDSTTEFLLQMNSRKVKKFVHHK